MCTRRTRQLAQPGLPRHESAGQHPSVDSIVAGPRRCSSLREVQHIRRELERAAARAGTVPGGLHGKPGALTVFPDRQSGAQLQQKPAFSQSPPATELRSAFRTVGVDSSVEKFNWRERNGQSWKFLRKVVTTLANVPAAPKSTGLSRSSLVSTTIRERKLHLPPAKSDEMLETRTTGQEAAQLTTVKAEGEVVFKRLRQAALLTGFADVVDNASYHQGLPTSNDTLFVQRVPRTSSSPATTNAQDDAQPRLRMWGDAMESSGFSRASSV